MDNSKKLGKKSFCYNIQLIMKKIIFFCQAPADAKYILSIYAREIKKYTLLEVSIIVVNVESLCAFFENLKLNASVEYISLYKDFKKINILNDRLLLYKLYKKKFALYKDYDVYFFSRYYDYVTFFLVDKMSAQNHVYYVDHYDQAIAQGMREPGLMERLVWVLYYSLRFGVYFQVKKQIDKYVLEYRVENNDKVKLDDVCIDENVFDLYKYVFTKQDGEKSVLLLESNYLMGDYYCDYEEVTCGVIGELKNNGYKIYLKPHPRKSYSVFLKDLVDSIIAPDLPSEFIGEDEFDLIVGVNSIAMVFFAERSAAKVISLLDMYKFKNELERKRFKELLGSMTKNIIYIDSIEKIITMSS